MPVTTQRYEELAQDANTSSSGDADLTAASSQVAVRVVTAHEDVMVARGVRAALGSAA